MAWNSTGNATGSHGDSDVFPTSGEVVFLEGETRKTINLTIVADDIPEVNEVLFVRYSNGDRDVASLILSSWSKRNQFRKREFWRDSV